MLEQVITSKKGQFCWTIPKNNSSVDMVIFQTVILLSIFMPYMMDEILYLSPYIESGLLDVAKNMSAVNGLPNAPTVESYSGYITVDKQYDSHMFFWFFPSFNNPQTAPVMIWLNGVIGESSIWSIFSSNPVFTFSEDKSLSINPNAWAHNYSIIYIDNPIGAGFSFTRNETGYSQDMNSVANNLYEFLQQFFTLFAEYRNNDFYIMSEIYGGKYVSALGYKLMQMSNESNINLKGISLGNPWFGPLKEYKVWPILKSLGLIDEKQMETIKESVAEEQVLIMSQNFTEALNKRKQLWSLIYEDILKLSFTKPITKDLSHFVKVWQDEDKQNFLNFLNLNGIDQALHVNHSTFNFINYNIYTKLEPEYYVTMERRFTELFERYRVMIYVGNFGFFWAGIDSISVMLEDPEWRYYSEFYHAEKRAWKIDQDEEEIIGFIKSFDNFTYAMVRNAGHQAIYDRPRAVKCLIDRFINNQLLDNEI